MCRNLYLHLGIFISVNCRIIHGCYALSFQSDFCPRLCTRFNLTDNISIQRMDLYLSSEHSCCIRNFHRRINVLAFSLVTRFSPTLTLISRSPSFPLYPFCPFPFRRTDCPFAMPAGICTSKFWLFPSLEESVNLYHSQIPLLQS